MREIKFRAWDKKNKKIVENFLFFDKHYTKESGNFLLPKTTVCFTENIMQYTGLLDKNGKEIYEGDILKNNNGNTWEVKWNAYMWDMRTLFLPRYKGDKEKGTFECKDTFWKKHEFMEIIGNIYENPELLKQ